MLQGGSDSRLQDVHYTKATRAYFDGTRGGFLVGVATFVGLIVVVGRYFPEGQVAMYAVFTLITLASLATMALTIFLVRRRHMAARDAAHIEHHALREAETQKGIDAMLRAESNIPKVGK